MRFDVLTLFPELFAAHFEHGVTRRAYAPGEGGAQPQVDVRLWPLRAHGAGVHQRVDDRPFGGGPGMVMQAPVLAAALAAALASRAEAAPVLLFSPTGRALSQAMVREMAQGPGAVLVCGRYEGIDQRFIDQHVTHEVSLGDFVLSGGEIPALALLDAVARLQAGVLHDPASHEQDSFGEPGLLDCPHYTQPAEWAGQAVPEVLASGHHARIAAWRHEQSLRLTAERRPDLLQEARRQGRLSPADERFLANLPPVDPPNRS